MPTPRQLHRSALAATLAVIFAGCGGSDAATSPTETASTSMSIDVGDNVFTPRNTTVPVGSTVTWTWKGSQPHDITFATGPSSTIKTSGTFARQFTAVGTYDYICAVHGSAMSGQVIVR